MKKGSSRRLLNIEYETFDVTFEETGALGLILEKIPGRDVIVKEVRRDSVADKSDKVQKEDILYAVNGIRTAEQQVNEILELLTNKRPVRLTLKRLRDDERRSRIAEQGHITTSPRRPTEYAGQSSGEKVTAMFKEWKRLGPHFDFSDENLEFIIGFEFAPLSLPTPSQLMDSVCRMPKQSGRLKDRYDPFTGKKLPESERYKFSPDNGRSVEKVLQFEQGQWVEYLGEDMTYRLAPVRRIIRQVDPEWEPEGEDDIPDYDYFFSVGTEMKLDPRSVRSPEEAIKLLFGFRPFIFQQWALLQVESATRFAEHHDQDFQSLNFRAEAQALWTQWMDHESNQDFKELCEQVESTSPGSTEKLLSFIMSPFTLMDDISKNAETWDMAGNVNVYMYVALFGSGYATAIICAAIQLLSPGLLLQWQISREPGASRFVDWSTFCLGEGTWDTRVMNTVVLLLYTIRVLPDISRKLFASWDGSSVSRLNAMRQKIFEQGDDTFWMKIAFKLNVYLNGGFVVFLYVMMLFILFLTDSIFDIILNALAMEFVASLDEELSASQFYDNTGRYIAAGTVELVLRDVLDLDTLRHWRSFCSQYDVPRDAYVQAFNGKPKGLFSRSQGRKDQNDPRYLSKELRFRRAASRVAAKANNKLAIWNFVEPVVAFGVFDQLWVWMGIKDTGIFHRYQDYYCWSRWDKVLFIAPIPRDARSRCESKLLLSNCLQEDEDEDNYDTGSSSQCASKRRGRRSWLKQWLCYYCMRKSKREFLNFDNASELTPVRRFLKDLIGILMFGNMYKSLLAALKTGNLFEIPFRIVDGFIEWLNYMMQASFPLMLLGFYYLVFACY